MIKTREEFLDYLNSKPSFLKYKSSIDNPPLSNHDIQDIFPKSNICWLKDYAASATEERRKEPQFILIPNPGTDVGHWVCVCGRQYFDSYAQEIPPELSQYRLVKSKYCWQSDESVDCGKWVILRALYKELSNAEFNRQIHNICNKFSIDPNTLIDLLVH